MTAKTTPVDPVQDAFDNAPIGEPETDEEPLELRAKKKAAKKKKKKIR